MEPALAGAPVRDFPEPRSPPRYSTFQRGPSALSYDPYYVAADEPRRTTETEHGRATDEAEAAGRPPGTSRPASDAAASEPTRPLRP